MRRCRPRWLILSLLCVCCAALIARGTAQHEGDHRGRTTQQQHRRRRRDRQLLRARRAQLIRTKRLHLPSDRLDRLIQVDNSEDGAVESTEGDNPDDEYRGAPSYPSPAEHYPYGGGYYLAVNSKGFQKCYDMLEKTAVDGKVYPNQYLAFLTMISDGELVYSKLARLPAELFVLFFATACSSGLDCKHYKPFIWVENRGVHLSLLRFFCQEVLSHIYTETTVRFEFSIRYDSSVVSSDKASMCLSQATENLLLKEFGCSIGELRRDLVVDTKEFGRDAFRTKLSGDPDFKRNGNTKQTTVTAGRDLYVRQNAPSLDSSDWDDSQCPYEITNDVNILDFGKYSPPVV